MKIEHIAIYVKDLEVSRNFYCQYFGGKASAKYENPRKQFTSYFISFDGGCRLELMNQPFRKETNSSENIGIHHFAFTVGSRDKVDELTNLIRNNGFIIHGEPRVTGDGYYESIVLDPEGNMVEITE
jgi:lactoylglutathione lyase